MPTKSEIEAEIARIKSLPETPERLRQIKALERCLGMEIRPAKAKGGRKGTSGEKKSYRKRTVAEEVDDDEEEDEGKGTPEEKSDFNASDYLRSLLGVHHRGMN